MTRTLQDFFKVQSCVAQTLSRSATRSALQRNTTSIINIRFNDVLFSACKLNLSAQLLYAVMVKKYSLKIGGTPLQERPRSGTQKPKGLESLF